MNRRRNALADIFDGLTAEKIEQLQRCVNTDSGFEDELSSSADEPSSPDEYLVDPTYALHTTSSPLDRFTDQSNPIDIFSRQSSLSGIFHDTIAANCSAFMDFESRRLNEEEAVSDDEEEDERFVEFLNSPRYFQRRLGIAENTFRENLNMLNGITASH